MKDTSDIHRIKDELLVNPATVSDFKKALRRKHNIRLSEDSALCKKRRQTFTSQVEESLEIANKLITYL